MGRVSTFGDDAIKLKTNKLTISVILAIMILIVNGVIIYRSFFQVSAVSQSENSITDPAEMADRAGPGNYIEINSSTDYTQAAKK